MRSAIVMIVAVALTAFAVNTAVADTEHHSPGTAKAKQEKPRPKPVAIKQSPLVLPDIQLEARQVKTTERASLPAQVRKSTSVLAFWNGRGKWMRATRVEKCWQVPWQRQCTISRANHKLHTVLLAAARHRLQHELPSTNDWRTAVRIVQRVYPGTEDWLLAISRREGGYGPWVWYGGRHWGGYHIGDDFLGADTVGGWMQFRFSTFAPYWRGAQKDLRARGYEIPRFPDRGGPEAYQPWLDPLGQALTGAYMRYYGKDGCHWCL